MRWKQERGIKCLSLVFIDKVANYVSEDPIIKNLFVKKYKELYPEFHNNENPTANKIEFIFFHSALGVGWDNPNIFNIATLSNSYSEIKKRQEIGRGLRICVNREGHRIYGKSSVEDTDRINQLTVIPNELYRKF